MLLADEPSAALDNLALARLISTLESCCTARGVALLLVTHDLALASRACSQALVLDGGRVVEAGSLATLVGAPVHDTTRAMVAAARRADDLWRLVDAAPGQAEI